MQGNGVGIQQLQQQIVPALQEQRAVIQLDAQHVGRRRGCRERQQIIANLARARRQIVFATQRRQIGADQCSLTWIRGDSRVGGPDSAGRRVQ